MTEFYQTINSFVEPTEGTWGIQELQQDSEKINFIPIKAIMAIITTFITFIIFSDSYKWYIIDWTIKTVMKLINVVRQNGPYIQLLLRSRYGKLQKKIGIL